MTVLDVAAFIFLPGALFLLWELISAPKGLEDATGFHIVKEAKAQQSPAEEAGLVRAVSIATFGGGRR